MTASRRLGKYEILEEIGRGGFAVVYKARDTTLNRVVALKVLHPQLTTDPRFVQRFHQEAQTAARLRHPHIVTIHEVGEEAGQHYLAMAYLPGRTLDERLSATRGPLPVELAISIVEQIADALDTIHQQGLVHRDVKPANIIVDKKGQATLLDFGIVRAAEGTRVTTTMAVLGTPEYMAPEQAELQEGVDIDWRADIYALGVVAYEMLVGQPPFTGKSPTAILHKHVYEPPPEPTTLNPSLPAGLEPVLLQALAKKREDRYQGTGAFVAELRRALLTDSQILEREAQLAPLYRQMQAAAAEENWPEVLALGGQIEALDASYRDVSQHMAHARQQLRQPQRAPTEPTPQLQPAPRERAEGTERKARRIPALNWRVAGLAALPVLVCICLIAGWLLLDDIFPPPDEIPTPTVPTTPPPTVPTTPPLTVPTTPPPTPTPTPDGGGTGKIAFHSDRDGNSEIYVMNADGSGQTNLTNNPDNDAVPSWSPDGTRITFHSDRDGNHEIYVMNADGSGQTNLTDNSEDDWEPSWSPDGTRIAFTSGRDDSPDIYVMNADGSGQTNLTNNSAIDNNPAWSPWTRIVFESYRDGNLEIYVMNADGNGQTRLTNNTAYDGDPAWLPWTRIAFTSNRDGNYEIYVMNFDGSELTNLTNLTNNPASDSAPSWSPDGTRIAFTSNRDGNYEIYVMNADGSGQTRLTINSANDKSPVWQPAP